MRRGDQDVRDRAVGGRGRVRRLLLPLAARIDPGDGTPVATDVHQRHPRHKQRNQRPRFLMKWPFARHAHSSPAVGESTGASTAAEPTRTEVDAPARREWASLPPLEVAGARPINLTAPTRTFTEGLASRQVLVRAPRLEMVRGIDAPSGSLRGVLAPTTGGRDDAGMPELQEASPLPAGAHRDLGASTGDDATTQRLTPLDR